RLLHQAPDLEVPGGRVELRDLAVMEDRPLLSGVLAGRQAVAERLGALGSPTIEEVERHRSLPGAARDGGTSSVACPGAAHIDYQSATNGARRGTQENAVSWRLLPPTPRVSRPLPG